MATLIGDNSKVLTDKERRVLKAHHITAQMAKKAQIKQLQEQIKDLKKTAKEDGFSAAEIDHFIKTLEAKDKQKPVTKYLAERGNLITLGLIPDQPQGDLLADRATKEQNIFAAGSAAGLLGVDPVSGYDGGSADDKTWLSGWKSGQAEMAEHLQTAMEKANAKRLPAEGTEDPFGEDAP